MFITQEIRLELQEIDFVENPMSERGKFISYGFRMDWPLASAFFNEEWPKRSEEYLTVVWGGSPEITYYAKESRKSFQSIIEKKISEALPVGFMMKDVTRYKLRICDFSKPKNDRQWAICYDARYQDKNNNTISHIISGARISVDSNFMSRIIALIPEKVQGKFKQEA